ncbi:hypothetical protein [Bacillus paranthracis]|uniref:hypothetical protein n=1 Tax=Bacillus paranthracis TaxID=2026186 RepID=UPI0022DEF316|nr:hypothetical protein [Bacillus paranthracis]
MANDWMKGFKVTLILDGQTAYQTTVRSKSKQAAIVNVLTNKYKGKFDSIEAKEVIDTQKYLKEAASQVAQAFDLLNIASMTIDSLYLENAFTDEQAKRVQSLFQQDINLQAIALLRNELVTIRRELEEKK